MTKIRAVIFDCFGVLVTEAWPQFLQTQVQDKDTRRAVLDIQKSMNTGMISEQEFVRLIAEATSLTVAEVRSLLFRTSAINDTIFLLIEKLKLEYPLGLLSNISSERRLKEFLTESHIELFDALVLSGEVGVVKPAREIYLMTAERLGVAAEECIFIDDIARYCAGAREAGMVAIQYESVGQLQRELAKYGILTP